MPKPNLLAQGLEQQDFAAKVTNIASLRQSSSKSVARSRYRRVLIGKHLAPKIQTALKIVPAEEPTTMQALLAESTDTAGAEPGKLKLQTLQHAMLLSTG